MKQYRLSAISRQTGASAIVIMIIVLFFGGLFTLGIKIGPAYMDDLTIQEVVEGVRDTEGLAQLGPAQILEIINKRLRVNSVRSLKSENIKVEKSGNVVLINVDYEVRENLFRNVDTIVYFQHEYEMIGE